MNGAMDGDRFFAVVEHNVVIAVTRSARRVYAFAVAYWCGGHRLFTWHTTADGAERQAQCMTRYYPRLFGVYETFRLLDPGEPFQPVSLPSPHADPAVLVETFTADELQQWLEETWNRS